MKSDNLIFEFIHFFQEFSEQSKLMITELAQFKALQIQKTKSLFQLSIPKINAFKFELKIL